MDTRHRIMSFDFVTEKERKHIFTRILKLFMFWRERQE